MSLLRPTRVSANGEFSVLYIYINIYIVQSFVLFFTAGCGKKKIIINKTKVNDSRCNDD